MLIETNVDDKSIIKLEWIDPINNSNFNFFIYKTDSFLSDLSDNTKSHPIIN